MAGAMLQGEIGFFVLFELVQRGNPKPETRNPKPETRNP